MAFEKPNDGGNNTRSQHFIPTSTTPTPPVSFPHRPSLTLLTVGDGDFSASLAIVTAYPLVVDRMVATTLLPHRQAVVDTYPSSSSILEELEADSRITILYEVDATQLHNNVPLQALQLSYDLILFQYPHLGYSHNDDGRDHAEESHAERHAQLVAQYLASARQIFADNGCVHLCLCQGSETAWQLDDSLQRLGMEIMVRIPTSQPLLDAWRQWRQEQQLKLRMEEGKESVVNYNDEIYKNDKQKKNKTGGSRKGHWLGKYGYRHQPTFPRATAFQTNVSKSFHYFMQPKLRKKDDDCSSPTQKSFL